MSCYDLFGAFSGLGFIVLFEINHFVFVVALDHALTNLTPIRREDWSCPQRSAR